MTFLYGILGLGFLIFFHELGHFIAANAAGVKVEAFSIGMGPVLIHKKIRETDYRISLIPLGGYCAMKGEQDFRKALEDNLKTIQADKDSFYGIHPLLRLLIAFAGPFFNFLFSFLAFFIISVVGYTYYSAGTIVQMADEVYPEINSPAHKAGLKTGDKIISINGNKVFDFMEIAAFVSTHPDEDLSIIIERDSKEFQFTVHSDLDKSTGSGKIGIVSDKTSIEIREHKSDNLYSAVAEGFSESIRTIVTTVKSVRLLFKGIDVKNAVSGPVRITSMLGDTVKQGFKTGAKSGIVSTLEFLAVISISLFMTNLLPVSVLDGGLIFIAFAEWISGKKLPPKILYYIQMTGIAIIGLIMIFAFFGDILYFIKK